MKPFGKKAKNEYDTNDDVYSGGFYRGYEDEEDGLVEEPEEVETVEQAPAKPVAPKAPAGNNMLKVVAPHSYDDAPEIVKHLIDGYTVVLNIEGMDRNAAMRLIDFLLGALEVLDGDFRPVTKTTLVFSPAGNDVSGADFE